METVIDMLKTMNNKIESPESRFEKLENRDAEINQETRVPTMTGERDSVTRE